MTARNKRQPKARFAWDDPLLLNDQLTDDERMVRDHRHPGISMKRPLSRE